MASTSDGKSTRAGAAVRDAVRFTALTLVVLFAAGCGGEKADSADGGNGLDNSAQICAEFTTANTRHLGNETPEGKAYADAMKAAYTGDPAATADLTALHRRHFEAWHGEIASLAERAQGETVRQALEAYADKLRLAAEATGSDRTGSELVATLTGAKKACGQGG